MEEPLTQTWQMQLTRHEGEALESLAAVLNIPPLEALRTLFLSGMQMALAVEADATDAGLAGEEVVRRMVRGFLVHLSEPANAETLRTVASAFHREAEEIENWQRRQDAIRGMREFREAIRERVGNIPDIEGLIDLGRDDG